MDNYAAWWQSRNKQPDTSTEPQKTLSLPKKAVDVEQVDVSQSTEHQQKQAG